ncbi:MAG TPA: trypsin-like serine protease [Polyangiaceae bacterium]|nr:trypsin-like serine protease [Polyangiaceae bacterium]
MRSFFALWSGPSNRQVSKYAYSLLGCVALACSGAESADVPELDTATADSELIGGTEFTSAQAKSMGVIKIKDGCTATLVSRRHILTAAHCLPPPVFKIAQVGKVTANTAWTTVTQSFSEGHPSWYVSCALYGCRSDLTLIPPFPSDLLIVTLFADVPASFGLAKIPRMNVSTNKDVWISGYGCEAGVNGPAPNPYRLKAKMVKTLSASAVNTYREEMPSELTADFGAVNILTPGIAASASAASLCPGDSGGPLLLSSDPNLGPPVPRNWVLGVNAYYVFKENDTTGKSVRNIHARLWDNGPVQAWLESILPASSFVNP